MNYRLSAKTTPDVVPAYFLGNEAFREISFDALV
jgi:hypothetical protein